MKLSLKLPKKDLQAYLELLHEWTVRNHMYMMSHEKVNAKELYEQLVERLGAHSDKATDYRIKWTFQHHYMQTIRSINDFAAGNADIFYQLLAKRIRDFAEREFDDKVRRTFIIRENKLV